MRRIVWIAPWLIATCFSCTQKGDTVTKPEAVKTPDIVREDEGFKSSYYDPENPYTVRQVSEAGESDVVEAAVEKLASEGYASAPEYSFAAEGVDPNGERVEITAIAMVSPPELVGDMVYVLFIHGDGYAVAIPLRISIGQDPPEEEFEEIGDGVWMGFAEEPVGIGGASSSARVVWGPWLSCVAERLLSGAASCAVSCRWTLNFYLHCFAKCTAGYAIYAMIYCAFMQF